jgi:two-component system, chemotaxis family, sensor kinase CheA
VRDSALQLRMVQIGATFNRFQRVVRDVARAGQGHRTGHQRRRHRTRQDRGREDRRPADAPGAQRHGPRHRIARSALAAASRRRARCRLNAFHDSGSIVIEVSDDGGGLNRERILAKAIERGLVSGPALSDNEVYQLIFEPGFSTAEQVTNLSGRGVGMDVVKRNIRRCAARSTSTAAGQGTTVTDPAAADAGHHRRLPGRRRQVGVRDAARHGRRVHRLQRPSPGTTTPTCAARCCPSSGCARCSTSEGAGAGENIVVLKHAGQKAGLVVDTLLGEFQTVIKPLGSCSPRSSASAAPPSSAAATWR